MITTVVSGLYTLNYLVIIDNALVALINLLFTLAYALTLLFSHFNATRRAKIWFFCVLMVHLMVCTNVYVTNESGFHLYFYLVPTGAFLLFDLQHKAEKIVLSLCALIGYLYCENTLNASPLIVLTPEMNHYLHQSVVIVTMIEVIVVLLIFVNEIERNEAKLELQATTDALTGILNRRSFFELGSKAVEEAQQASKVVSLLILDIDHFKQINDNNGHSAGDECLKKVCQFITSRCRIADLFARVGGEEFAILLPNTGYDEAFALAEQIRTNIANQRIEVKGNLSIACTVSIGITSSLNSDDTLQSLLESADHALYTAKSEGRNRSVVHCGSVDTA
jgi:diguanylate cyclase (GGDEF)-like protein